MYKYEPFQFTLKSDAFKGDPNDKDFLIRLLSDNQDKYTWQLSLTRIHKAWYDTRGIGVKVAIIDSGVQEDHPDLEGAVIDYKDFTGEGKEDHSGHGTHVAGIIGSRINQKGLLGIAPECSLLVAKIIGKEISPKGIEEAKRLAKAIDWAVEKEADIISISLGVPSLPEVYSAVHSALSANIFVIAAAGNNGSFYRDNIVCPGCYGSVITVGAHDSNGNPAGFSSRGGQVDFLAPGTNIWSTHINSSYAKLDGTSMATPFVAGLSALIVAKHKELEENGGNLTPLINNFDLKEHLSRMSSHPGYHDPHTGYGPLLPFLYF